MSNELAVPQGSAMMPAQPTPMQLIAQASTQDVSIERMQQLFELQMRWEANEARKAYNDAFSAFKAEAIVVGKNVDVKDGPLKGKKYTNLDGAVRAITPFLSKHNLSHSWKLTKDDRDWLEVTCTINHSQGHSESVSMGAAPDTGPGRNAIQARMSAVNYLERYTFLAATGHASSDGDDDGNGAGKSTKPRLSDEDFESRLNLISAAETVSDLQKVYTPANKAAVAIDDKESARAFTNAKNKRYRELVPVKEEEYTGK